MNALPVAEASSTSTQPPLDPSAMQAIAAGIAASNPGEMIPHGTHRRWVLVVSTEAYEAWAIAWPAGTGLGMHDHDGSTAAVAIVNGRLRERYVDLTEGGHTGIAVRWLAAGDTVHLAGDHIHEVINVGDDEAVSIHVYSPPLADMAFRDDPEIVLGVDGVISNR